MKETGAPVDGIYTGIVCLSNDNFRPVVHRHLDLSNHRPRKLAPFIARLTDWMQACDDLRDRSGAIIASPANEALIRKCVDSLNTAKLELDEWEMSKKDPKAKSTLDSGTN